MAVTKILSIKKSQLDALEYILDDAKTTLGNDEEHQAVNYITNAGKTNEGELVSSYNCSPEHSAAEFAITQELAREVRGDFRRVGGADIRAYHIIQSFPPEEQLTPREAHEIGQKLMQEFLGGQHEFVIATHIDREHLHNHIIFNATSFYSFTKFRTQPYKTAAKLRSISDKLCAEHGLQVLPEHQPMKKNYRLYQKYRSMNTYRVQIRQRMNFLLESETNLNDLLRHAKELDVTIDLTGKYATYTCGAQIRNTRDNKLSDDGRFSREGLLERLEENQRNIAYLEKNIEESFNQSTTMEDFEQSLKKSSITYKKNRHGWIVFTLSETEQIHIPERAINQGYAINKLNEHFRQGTSLKSEESKLSLKELFDQQSRTNASETDSPVTISSEFIEEKTKDGLLIKVDNVNGDQGFIFINASHVDQLSDKLHYQIHLGNQFNYYFMKDGQQTNYFIKGETLLRQLETKIGVPTHKIEVSAANILSITDKGISLSFEKSGIQRLFLPKEAVHVEKLSQKVYVELSENWNYYYQKTSSKTTEKLRKKIPSQGIKGQRLLQIIEDEKPTLDIHLKRQLDQYQQQLVIKETKQLAEALSLLRRNKVKDIPDLLDRIDALETQIEEAHHSIAKLERKIAEYNLVAKYLVAYQKYAEEMKKTERGIESNMTTTEKHLYQTAEKELKKRGIQSFISSEKVVALVKQNIHQELNLKRRITVLVDELISYQGTKELLTQLSTTKQLAKEKEIELI